MSGAAAGEAPCPVGAAVAVGVLAFAIGFPILKLKGHYLAMATLGFGVIVYIVLNETVDLTDGIKVVWPDRWLQARGSNTEPIIRVTAEAPTEDEARALAAAGLAALA